MAEKLGSMSKIWKVLKRSYAKRLMLLGISILDLYRNILIS